MRRHGAYAPRIGDDLLPFFGALFRDELHLHLLCFCFCAFFVPWKRIENEGNIFEWGTGIVVPMIEK